MPRKEFPVRRRNSSRVSQRKIRRRPRLAKTLVDATEKKEQRLRERARSEREWQNRIASYDAERALINQEHLRR